MQHTLDIVTVGDRRCNGISNPQTDKEFIICSIVGRSDGLAFQQFEIRFHVWSSIAGLSSRSGRIPSVINRMIRKLLAVSKGTESKNICLSLFRSLLRHQAYRVQQTHRIIKTTKCVHIRLHRFPSARSSTSIATRLITTEAQAKQLRCGEMVRYCYRGLCSSCFKMSC